jgi:hypothetical protein
MSKIIVSHSGTTASRLYLDDIDRDDESKEQNQNVTKYISPGESVTLDLGNSAVFYSYTSGTLRGYLEAGFVTIQESDSERPLTVKVSVDSLEGDSEAARQDPLNVPFVHPQDAIDWAREVLEDSIILEVHIGKQTVDIGPPIVVCNGWSAVSPIFGNTVEEAVLLINRPNTRVLGYDAPVYGDGNNTFDAVVVANVTKAELLTWYNAGGATWDVDADGIYSYTGQDFSAFTTELPEVEDVVIRNLAPTEVYAFGAFGTTVDDLQVDACTLRQAWLRGVETAYFGARNIILAQDKGFAFVESNVDWDVEASISSLDDGSPYDAWVYANKNDTSLGPASSNAGWGLQDSSFRVIPGTLAFDGHAANASALFHCQDLRVHRDATFRYFKMDNPNYPVQFQTLMVGGDLTLFGCNRFVVDTLHCDLLTSAGTTLTVNGGTVRGVTTITDGNVNFRGVTFLGNVILDTDGTVNLRGCEITAGLTVNGNATVNVDGGSVVGGTTDNSGGGATINRDAGL